MPAATTLLSKGFEAAYNFINASPKKAQMLTIAVIMICRPTIMLMDKAVPPKTRRYAATREFFTELIGGSSVFAFGGLLEWIVSKAYKNHNPYEHAKQKLKSEIDKTSFDKGFKLFKQFMTEHGAPKIAEWEKEISKQGVTSKELPKLVKDVMKSEYLKLALEKPTLQNMIKTNASWLGTTVAVAIITPWLNNHVINADVLNFIEKKLTGKDPTKEPGYQPPGAHDPHGLPAPEKPQAKPQQQQVAPFQRPLQSYGAMSPFPMGNMSR